MKYTHVFADAQGVTHFKDVPYSLKEVDYSPPAPLIQASGRTPASGMVVVAFPTGWYGDYHPAPKKQWMIVLSGKFEIGVSDGETRTMTAGTVILADEVGSKGHTTRAIEAGAFLAVEIE